MSVDFRDLNSLGGLEGRAIQMLGMHLQAQFQSDIKIKL